MKWKKKNDIIVVIMEHGEDFLENIKKLIESPELPELAIVVTALGMLNDVEMGYFDGEKYEIHKLAEPAELLGVSGLITKDTDPPYHFHVTLGKKDGGVTGGHLLEGKVWNTVEMVLLVEEIKLRRIPLRNLKLLDFS
ncbi:MAG TPA: DNA-binding protein [candidate division WOR-3 bacterium]|uniref:DNA-binding protein n=1 Tax=candidate division WOR-3 bacterium TaxID=2052148 RepID=A0A7V5HN99_UNCW3|nr:DNA-binding protein [candidate division WOR-3 bacterium]